MPTQKCCKTSAEHEQMDYNASCSAFLVRLDLEINRNAALNMSIPSPPCVRDLNLVHTFRESEHRNLKCLGWNHNNVEHCNDTFLLFYRHKRNIDTHSASYYKGYYRHGGVFVVFWHDFGVIFLPLNFIFFYEKAL